MLKLSSLGGVQNISRFGVRSENCLFLVWGSIDLFLCWLVKFGWFLYAGRQSLAFGVSIGIDLVFVWVVEIDLSSVRGMLLDLISV